MKKLISLFTLILVLSMAIMSVSIFATEKSPDQPLAKADFVPGWWFNPMSTDKYIKIAFTSDIYFSGFSSLFYMGTSEVSVKISLKKADDATVLETVDYTGSGDKGVKIEYSKTYAPGEYIIEILSVTEPGANRYFVLASASAVDGGKAVTLTSNADTNESTKAAPYIVLTGSEIPQPKTSDSYATAGITVSLLMILSLCVICTRRNKESA